MADSVHYLDCEENKIILTLEDMLARAHRGEVDGLFVAGVLECGDVVTGVVLKPDGGLYSLLGAVEAAKSVLVASFDEHFRETIASKWTEPA